MTRRKQPKWGILFSGDKLSMDDVIRYAQMAEDAGAESLWTAELWRDAFVPLTAIAGAVGSVRVGTAVAHFARPPLLTELSAMSLAEYTGGRFVLGLGTAPKDWNENWHGLAYRRPVERMREYIECIRSMWTSSPEKSVSYDGQFYKLKDYRRMMAPAYDRVPIYLAAVLPHMIHLAGSHADGLIVNVLNTPRYLTELIHPNLKKGLSAAGRSPDHCELCAVKCCAVSKDRKTARALARHAVAFYSTIPYFDAVLDPAGFAEPKMAIRAAMGRGDILSMLDAVTDDMIDALVLAGTADDVHRRLEKFEGLFKTLLLLSPSFAADPEEVRANHAAMIEAFGP